MSPQKINWNSAKIINLLSKYPNSEVARRLEISRARVSIKRKELGIKAPKDFKHKLQCSHCKAPVERRVMVEDPICYSCKKGLIVELNKEKRKENREEYNKYWRNYRKKKKRKNNG